MKVGDAREVTRRFTAAEVAELEALGGPAMAPGVLPEPLIGALFSYLLGVGLPGPGTNYLKQQTDYLRPAPVDQPLTARVEITRIRPDKNLVDLATTCRDAGGALIATGRALVYVEDVPGKGW